MTLKLSYAFLRFGCLPAGLLLLSVGWALALPPGWASLPWGLVKLFSLLSGATATLVGTLVIHNLYFSQNRAQLILPLETWAITHDRLHNSNVDLVWYREAFYLVHAASPYHFGSANCLLLIKRSMDGHNWEQVAVLRHGKEDLRDPKFAVIGEKLFLYVYLNRQTQPLPYTTRVSWTEDGEHWSDLSSVGQEGWLFWRPKTRDGETWYLPAYWHKFNHNVLFATKDGLQFERIGTIATGRFITEPEIEFLSDGSLLATSRAEYLKESIQQLIGIPQCSTIISVAQPPYTSWQETAEIQLTRLDGPVMFSHNGRVFAVGRGHPHSGAIFPRRGSAIAPKRTAIYEIHPQGLTYISDLPSCGDTSYAGVITRDGFAYITYYTNDIRKDYLWLFGMMEPSEIRMAKIALDDLQHAADQAQISPTIVERLPLLSS